MAGSGDDAVQNDQSVRWSYDSKAPHRYRPRPRNNGSWLATSIGDTTVCYYDVGCVTEATAYAHARYASNQCSHHLCVSTHVMTQNVNRIKHRSIGTAGYIIGDTFRIPPVISAIHFAAAYFLDVLYFYQYFLRWRPSVCLSVHPIFFQP